MARTVKQKIVTFVGRNSPTTVTIYDEGEPIDWAGLNTTKLGIVINGTEYSSEDGYLSFGTGGKLTFDLGSIQNPPSPDEVNYGRLVRYSAQFPLGRPLFTEVSDYRFQFQFL